MEWERASPSTDVVDESLTFDEEAGRSRRYGFVFFVFAQSKSILNFHVGLNRLYTPNE